MTTSLLPADPALWPALREGAKALSRVSNVRPWSVLAADRPDPMTGDQLSALGRFAVAWLPSIGAYSEAHAIFSQCFDAATADVHRSSPESGETGRVLILDHRDYTTRMCACLLRPGQSIESATFSPIYTSRPSSDSRGHPIEEIILMQTLLEALTYFHITLRVRRWHE
jgi:hypothetical protein